MPPRLSIFPAPRQWLPRLFSTTPSASLHTSSPNHAIKDLRPSSASKLMDIDAEAGRGPLARRSPSSRRGPSNLLSPNNALSAMTKDAFGNFRQSDKASINKQKNAEKLGAITVTSQYAAQMPRRWKTGDTYAPHDLSPEETKKWRRVRRADVDTLDALGLNPVDEYRNFAVISEFITPTGRIKHSKETGLRPVNQRRMAKAVRRAIGLGLHPSVHRHPELITGGASFRNKIQSVADKPSQSLF